jgi:asparagine synthase (glutamine-hydrolysing)
MCGIAGCVDFAVDLEGDRAAVEAMTRTMELRGPDEGGIWIDGHVALGNRRLAVIDLEGGKQPMLAHGDGDEVVAALTYSGETYNFLELRRELEATGVRFRTRSDTEVVLRAYLAWGRDFVTRLNGMYAFALWDARRGELLLVRDRLGIKPLFYAPTPNGVLFGSEPKAILAHPAFEPAVDEAALRELLTPISTPGATVWRGMVEVPSGSFVAVGRDGCRTETYWRLEAGPHGEDGEATVAAVRALLEDVAARQLVSDVPLCTLLSGGLDSSAITALAARSLEVESGPVRSFSVDFEGSADGFRSDVLRPDRDAPFVHDLAAHVGSEHTDIVLDSAALGDPEVREAVLRAYDRPPRQGDLSTSLYLLFRAIRERSTVALSGEAADELFGGYVWFHQGRNGQARSFPWLPGGGRLPPFSVLVPELESRVGLAEHRDRLYETAVADVPTLDGEAEEERRMRTTTYLHLTSYLPALLERKDRLSMAVGLEVRVPYCDHRLVEYVFNVPWSMKAVAGREKSLLRAAVADLLPRSVLERRKSHFPATQDTRYTEQVRDAYLGLLAEEGGPLFDIADPAKLRWLARDVDGGAAELLIRRAREDVLGLDAWLRLYRPRLVL